MKDNKLTHLEHVEDRALHSKEGYIHARDALHGVNDKLEGGVGPKISTKFDGSPSLVFGHDPKTGKFFVSTKSALNKTPIIYTNQKELDDAFKGRPDLHHKMSQAFEHLSKVAPKKGVYQGDLMYTKNDVHESGKHYNFTPNTLMYSVKKDSDEGKKVKSANLGIAIHTAYHGKDLESMRAGFNPDLSNFKKHKDVHIINPEITIHGGSKKNEEFRHHMKEAENAYLEAHDEAHKETEIHKTHMQSYIQQTSRTGQKATAAGFKQFLTKKFQTEADKLSSTAGKLKKMEALAHHNDHVDTHHDKYESLFTIHHHLQQAKNTLLEPLNKNNPYETSVGKEVLPSGEGFVVHHNDVPSKLVHREQFTRINAARHELLKNKAK